MSTHAYLRGMSPCNAPAGTEPEPPATLPRASIHIDERDATRVAYNGRNFSPPTSDGEWTWERLGELPNTLSAHQLADHRSKRLLVGCMSGVIVSDRLPS